MRRIVQSLILRTFPGYPYMTALKRLYVSPYDLLYGSLLSPDRLQYLLRRWRDDRSRYIFENCRDYDYQSDNELDELLQTVKVAKAIVSAQDKAGVSISIIYLDDKET